MAKVYELVHDPETWLGDAGAEQLAPGMRTGTGRNGVERGQWRQYEDWSGLGGSEGYEDVSARPDELAKKGIVFPRGVDIY